LGIKSQSVAWGPWGFCGQSIIKLCVQLVRTLVFLAFSWAKSNDRDRKSHDFTTFDVRFRFGRRVGRHFALGHHPHCRVRGSVVEKAEEDLRSTELTPLIRLTFTESQLLPRPAVHKTEFGGRKIPGDQLSPSAVNDWFGRYGTVTGVEVDPPSAKASKGCLEIGLWRSIDTDHLKDEGCVE